MEWINNKTKLTELSFSYFLEILNALIRLIRDDNDESVDITLQFVGVKCYPICMLNSLAFWFPSERLDQIVFTLLSSCVSRLDYSVYSLPVLTQINGKNKQKDVNPRKIFFKPAKYWILQRRKGSSQLSSKSRKVAKRREFLENVTS